MRTLFGKAFATRRPFITPLEMLEMRAQQDQSVTISEKPCPLRESLGTTWAPWTVTACTMLTCEAHRGMSWRTQMACSQVSKRPLVTYSTYIPSEAVAR